MLKNRSREYDINYGTKYKKHHRKVIQKVKTTIGQNFKISSKTTILPSKYFIPIILPQDFTIKVKTIQ